MISYGKQSIDQSDIDSVVEILKGNWITQGPAVKNFEDELINYFGSNHACAVSNGTAALHLTGLALGWQAGDIVLTSPITFLATANCIVYAGATPDFVDIDPITYTIDPNQVEDKIKFYQSQGKKVKAVIGIDFAGHPCDWKALRSIADKYGLQLVNDNCHAMGAIYYGDKEYAGKYADVVTQSYHAVKHITTGEGGAVLTKDITIDEKVRCLRAHGMTKDSNKLEKIDGPWYYEMNEVGYNYRLTNLQSAIGLAQMEKIEFFVGRKLWIAEQYTKRLSSIENLQLPVEKDEALNSYWMYTVVLLPPLTRK